MEDVLDIYKQPLDPDRPVICMDEVSKQLIAQTHVPIPARPGRPACYDYEYERHGTANVFMFVEPLRGWRWAPVTQQRTRADWAQAMKELLDGPYAQVQVVRLVMDNLNTHSVASFYEAFAPEEARRLAQRLEIHHTPKHGSWLNVAEIFLSILSRECLDQRIASTAELQSVVAAWKASRSTAKVKWRFTTADARIKLRRLYPSIP